MRDTPSSSKSLYRCEAWKRKTEPRDSVSPLFRNEPRGTWHQVMFHWCVVSYPCRVRIKMEMPAAQAAGRLETRSAFTVFSSKTQKYHLLLVYYCTSFPGGFRIYLPRKKTLSRSCGLEESFVNCVFKFLSPNYCMTRRESLVLKTITIFFFFYNEPGPGRKFPLRGQPDMPVSCTRTYCPPTS